MALANYKPFCGYWFYGAADDAERAAFFASWGLLDEAPTVSTAMAVIAYVLFRRWREA